MSLEQGVSEASYVFRHQKVPDAIKLNIKGYMFNCIKPPNINEFKWNPNSYTSIRMRIDDSAPTDYSALGKVVPEKFEFKVFELNVPTEMGTVLIQTEKDTNREAFDFKEYRESEELEGVEFLRYENLNKTSNNAAVIITIASGRTENQAEIIKKDDEGVEKRPTRFSIMSDLKVLVVLGSTREGRMCDRVANLLIKQLEKHQITVHKLDPLTLNPPTVTQPLHFLKTDATVPDWMTTTNNMIKSCDSVVIVTPEYNSSLPPALTNILDYFPPTSFRHKPVSLATYSAGPYGGVRAAALARPFLAELGMVSLPSTMAVASVQTAGIEEDGETRNEKVLNNAEKMVEELIWYTQAIHAKRQTKEFPNECLYGKGF